MYGYARLRVDLRSTSCRTVPMKSCLFRFLLKQWKRCSFKREKKESAWDQIQPQKCVYGGIPMAHLAYDVRKTNDLTLTTRGPYRSLFLALWEYSFHICLFLHMRWGNEIQLPSSDDYWLCSEFSVLLLSDYRWLLIFSSVPRHCCCYFSLLYDDYVRLYVFVFCFHWVIFLFFYTIDSVAYVIIVVAVEAE